MPAESTHPTLLARVRDPADREAWRELEVRYRDLIRRACRRRGLQVADAEDVGQLVMLALARALPGFVLDPSRGRFRDYLGRIVENAILRQLTRPRAAPALLDTERLDALLGRAQPDGALDGAWEEEWMQHHYRMAMQAVRTQVAPESVAVFERLLAGGSVAEVASERGTTPDAVHKIKQRMRERLLQRIEQQVRDEELPGAGS